MLAFVFIAVAAAVMLLVPTPAFADFFDDIAETVTEWFAQSMLDMANGWLQIAAGWADFLTANNALGAPWEDLFGGGGGASLVHQYLMTATNVAIKPIAHSILACVMLLQVIRISQRMDAHATMPAVKEIVFLMVFCIFFAFLINNADKICEMIYGLVLTIIDNMPPASSTGGITLDAIELDDAIQNPVGYAGGAMLMSLVVMVAVMIAYFITMLFSYARAIQLYIFAAFSPIPFALLGFEETRSFGISFIRNFAAVCLAGVIMLVMLIAFPLLLGDYFADPGSGSLRLVLGVTPEMLKLVVLSLLLCFGIFKSGTWAQSILGG
jgi:hypothetical protein